MSLPFIMVSYSQQSWGPGTFPPKREAEDVCVGGGGWCWVGRCSWRGLDRWSRTRHWSKEAQSQGSASSVRFHECISHSQDGWGSSSWEANASPVWYVDILWPSESPSGHTSVSLNHGAGCPVPTAPSLGNQYSRVSFHFMMKYPRVYHFQKAIGSPTYLQWIHF